MTSCFDDCNDNEDEDNNDDNDDHGHDNNNDNHDNDDNNSDEDNDSHWVQWHNLLLVNHFVKPTELKYLMRTHQTPAEYLQRESFSILHH